MIHSQFEKLADLLINHSCSLGKGEKVLIEAFDNKQAYGEEVNSNIVFL